jgi:hypothetical protein
MGHLAAMNKIFENPFLRLKDSFILTFSGDISERQNGMAFAGDIANSSSERSGIPC